MCMDMPHASCRRPLHSPTETCTLRTPKSADTLRYYEILRATHSACCTTRASTPVPQSCRWFLSLGTGESSPVSTWPWLPIQTCCRAAAWPLAPVHMPTEAIFPHYSLFAALCTRSATVGFYHMPLEPFQLLYSSLSYVLPTLIFIYSYLYSMYPPVNVEQSLMSFAAGSTAAAAAAGKVFYWAMFTRNFVL